MNEGHVRFTYRLLNHHRESEIRLIDPHGRPPKSVFVRNEEEFVKACREAEGRYNIYVGVNERKLGGTKAEDVVSVNVIPLDIDPVRPKNQASTEAEVALAVETGRKVQAQLKALGLDSKLAMSSNGAQVWIKVAIRRGLRNAEVGIKEFQRGIVAEFEDERVRIDNVGDLPRVIKVIGTLSIKGDNTPERPWRTSEWLDPLAIPAVNKEFEAKLLTFDPKDAKPIQVKAAPLDEGELAGILERIGPKGRDLFDGRWQQYHYPSRSEAEMALCTLLALKGVEPSKTSSVMAEATIGKWNEEREGYRELTLGKAYVWVEERTAGGAGRSSKRPPPPGVIRAELGDTEWAELSPRGIDFVYETKFGEHRRHVITGHLEIVSRMTVDGDLYFKLRQDEEIVAQVGPLVERFSKEGRVLSQRHVKDALSAVLRKVTEGKEEAGHATYGVYSEAGILKVCEDPHPLKDEQATAWEQMRGSVAYVPTKADIKSYIDMLPFWHPYEVLPSQGAGFAAPFTPVLKRAEKLVPTVHNWSPETDLGKSLTQGMVSDKAFARENTSGPSLESKYRFVAQIDSSCTAQRVEEADRIDRKLWPHIKESSERWLVDKRGTRELEMLRYHSRSVFLMNGNAINFEGEGILKRLLIVRFDSSTRLGRMAKAEEVEEKYNALQPIGFQLVRWAVELYPREEDLLKALAGWEQEIRAVGSGWRSPKRAQAWAVVYLGLKILEEGCRRAGVGWEAPPIPDFVRDVAIPVEASTWGLRRSHASRFASWLSMWVVEHTRTIKTTFVEEGRASYSQEDTIQGEGEIFEGGSIKVGDKELPGFWVTNALLDVYNSRADGENRIPSLAELARQAADETGLPYAEALDPDGKHARKVPIGGRYVRAAFIPFSLWGDTSNLGNLGIRHEPGAIPKPHPDEGALGIGKPGGQKTPLNSQIPTGPPAPPIEKEVQSPTVWIGVCAVTRMRVRIKPGTKATYVHEDGTPCSHALMAKGGEG